MRFAQRVPSVLAVLVVLCLILPLTGCNSGCRPPSLRAKEAVLRTNLQTLRDVIGQYRGDKGRRPESLEALVEAGYLRKVPIDPFTRSSESWVPLYAPSAAGARTREIVDVRSGASGRGRDGRLYREW